jgi:hypothetical protein
MNRTTVLMIIVLKNTFNSSSFFRPLSKFGNAFLNRFQCSGKYHLCPTWITTGIVVLLSRFISGNSIE